MEPQRKQEIIETTVDVLDQYFPLNMAFKSTDLRELVSVSDNTISFSEFQEILYDLLDQEILEQKLSPNKTNPFNELEPKFEKEESIHLFRINKP